MFSPGGQGGQSVENYFSYSCNVSDDASASGDTPTPSEQMLKASEALPGAFITSKTSAISPGGPNRRTPDLHNATTMENTNLNWRADLRQFSLPNRGSLTPGNSKFNSNRSGRAESSVGTVTANTKLMASAFGVRDQSLVPATTDGLFPYFEPEQAFDGPFVNNIMHPDDPVYETIAFLRNRRRYCLWLIALFCCETILVTGAVAAMVIFYCTKLHCLGEPRCEGTKIWDTLSGFLLLITSVLAVVASTIEYRYMGSLIDFCLNGRNETFPHYNPSAVRNSPNPTLPTPAQSPHEGGRGRMSASIDPYRPKHFRTKAITVGERKEEAVLVSSVTVLYAVVIHIKIFINVVLVCWAAYGILPLAVNPVNNNYILTYIFCIVWWTYIILTRLLPLLFKVFGFHQCNFCF